MVLLVRLKELMGKSCNLTWSIVTAGYWLLLALPPSQGGRSSVRNSFEYREVWKLRRYQVVFVTTETRNWELNVRVGSNAN